MNSRTYSLSFILDRDGWLKEDLVTSNSLYKLDNYIKDNFSDNKDVRKEFDEQISEFCLENMKLIKDENERNHHNSTGRIVILENMYDGERLCNTKCLKVIYQGSLLPSRKKCVSKIKKTLEDDDKLKELYTRKFYLLSPNELDLLRIYFRYHNVRYKENAIGFFTRRIKEESGNMAYYDCRHLANLCDLIEKEKKKVKNIGNINTDILREEVNVNREIPYQDVVVEQVSMDKILKKEGMNNV